MNKHIIISSDSTCDLSQELIDRYQIRILPMSYCVDTKAYQEENMQFWEKFDNK